MNAENSTVPEFIDPVFTKTSTKRSFSLNRKRAFWLVFVKTGSIISGTGCPYRSSPAASWWKFHLLFFNKFTQPSVMSYVTQGRYMAWYSSRPMPSLWVEHPKAILSPVKMQWMHYMYVRMYVFMSCVCAKNIYVHIKNRRHTLVVTTLNGEDKRINWRIFPYSLPPPPPPPTWPRSRAMCTWDYNRYPSPSPLPPLLLPH
jgi:hypothetical protein